MGVFDSTKQYIQSTIKDNNSGDISGNLLQSVLLNIVEQTELALDNINTRLDKIEDTLRDITINYDNE
jgi:enamine deaminase RidA (YjgF/YER057c/UK114 family)